MTFSIIIPVYNVAPYLRECLDSVLTQTCADWEAICIDDGSTDESAKILDEYAAKDLRFKVVHQINKGSSAARNVGLEFASGVWIWFVDADDFLETNALSIFLDFHNKADINYFSMRLLTKGNAVEKILPNFRSVTSDAEFDEVIRFLAFGALGDVLGWTCDKIIRHEIIERNNICFDETISFYEDEVFTIRVLEQVSSISTMPNVMYNYRIVQSGLTAQGMPDAIALAKAFLAAGESLHRDGLRQLIDARVTSILRGYLSREHSVKASLFLLKAKRRFPSARYQVDAYGKLLNQLGRLPCGLAAILLSLAHCCWPFLRYLISKLCRF